MPYEGDIVAARISLNLKAGSPPVWRSSGMWSGVFAKKFGQKYSFMSVVVSSVRYSVSSALLVRHMKYVYDWVKPALESAFIIFGRVNASERKMTPGCAAWTL